MTLTDRIKAWLAAHPGEPQSVTQLAAAIPEASSTSIASTCILMRMQGIIGRDGAGTLARPYRFFLKKSHGEPRTGG